jgi:hypothetical protein
MLFNTFLMISMRCGTFEAITSPPGFAVDEKPDALGTHLVLPPWLESIRSDLEKILPTVVYPKKNRGDVTDYHFFDCIIDRKSNRTKKGR